MKSGQTPDRTFRAVVVGHGKSVTRKWLLKRTHYTLILRPHGDEKMWRHRVVIFGPDKQCPEYGSIGQGFQFTFDSAEERDAFAIGEEVEITFRKAGEIDLSFVPTACFALEKVRKAGTRKIRFLAAA